MGYPDVKLPRRVKCVTMQALGLRLLLRCKGL